MLPRGARPRPTIAPMTGASLTSSQLKTIRSRPPRMISRVSPGPGPAAGPSPASPRPRTRTTGTPSSVCPMRSAAAAAISLDLMSTPPNFLLPYLSGLPMPILTVGTRWHPMATSIVPIARDGTNSVSLSTTAILAPVNALAPSAILRASASGSGGGSTYSPGAALE